MTFMLTNYIFCKKERILVNAEKICTEMHIKATGKPYP